VVWILLVRDLLLVVVATLLLHAARAPAGDEGKKPAQPSLSNA